MNYGRAGRSPGPPARGPRCRLHRASPCGRSVARLQRRRKAQPHLRRRRRDLSRCAAFFRADLPARNHHHPGKTQGARLGLLEHAHRLRSQDPGGAAHPGLAARRQAHHRARPAGAPGEQPGRRGVDRLRLRTRTEGWRPAARSATGRDRQSRAGTDVPGTADDERGRRRSKRRRPRRSGSPACRRRWHVPRRTRISAGCSARSIETRGCVAQARRGSLRCRSYRCARNVRQVIPCG